MGMKRELKSGGENMKYICVILMYLVAVAADNIGSIGPSSEEG